MDNLRTTAPAFYSGKKQFADAIKEHTALDEGGRQLIRNACRAKHIQEAKQYSFMRRTHTDTYLTRSEDGKELYLADFEDLGPRWVKDASEVSSIQNKGWYTDDMQDNTLIGVVLCFSRHAAPDEQGDTNGKGRQVFMAGTRHSDWDGVTLDLSTTNDMVTAARWADGMAERAAEICREEEEKYQNEQKVANLKEEIALARAACLKLLRDMRPIRKGMRQFPESVCQAMREQVQDYLRTIQEYRNQLGEIS